MKILKKLQWWIYAWIGFVLVVWVTGLSYAALSSLTATSWEPLTAAKWDALVEHAVPSWAAMAFNLWSCPTWWSKADGTSWNPDLRWEFIRGLDDWRWIDTGRTLATFQDQDWFTLWNTTTSVGSWIHSNSITKDWNYSTNLFTWRTTWASSYALRSKWNISDGSENRPRNVALLYCIKD